MSLNSQKGPYKEPPLYDKEPKSIDPYVVVISVTFTLIFFIVFVWIIGYCVKMSMEKNRARREQTDINNGLDPQNYAATTTNANENYRVAVTNHLLQRAERGSLDLKSLPCQNCNLISMGSMACYEKLCPECGHPPPS